MGSLLFHVRVFNIRQRDEGLFDGLGVAPPEQVVGAASLVIGT